MEPLEAQENILSSAFPHLCTNDAAYWSQTVGSTLRRMMTLAGFAPEDSLQQDGFFTANIAPWLGPRPKEAGEPPRKGWKSFMTDDGTPIELSWAWSANSAFAAVRYSVEPIVSTLSGTVIDPSNAVAPTLFAGSLLQSQSGILDSTDLNTYHRLYKLLVSWNCSVSASTSSQIFFAFDLHKSQRKPKVYFLPQTRAAELRCTPLELAVQALSIFLCSDTKATTPPQVVKMQSYISSATSELSIEILAFDVSPVHSREQRAKIYLRSRTLRFDTVCEIVTLGGRCVPSNWVQSIKEELRLLLKSLLQMNDHDLDEQNADTHRTGGLLFYYELRKGEEDAGCKIYVPVRHYARNDLQVAEAVQKHLKQKGQGFPNGMSYVEALQSLTDRDLKNGLGLHTYVAISMAKGQLSLMTYICPQTLSRDT